MNVLLKPSDSDLEIQLSNLPTEYRPRCRNTTWWLHHHSRVKARRSNREEKAKEEATLPCWWILQVDCGSVTRPGRASVRQAMCSLNGAQNKELLLSGGVNRKRLYDGIRVLFYDPPPPPIFNLDYFYSWRREGGGKSSLKMLAGRQRLWAVEVGRRRPLEHTQCDVRAGAHELARHGAEPAAGYEPGQHEGQRVTQVGACESTPTRNCPD